MWLSSVPLEAVCAHSILSVSKAFRLNGRSVRTGKSTTLKLITRMIEPSSGDILLDGVDIQKATLQSLRKKVAVIPQDTCLFDESIRYNILYG